MHIWAQEYAPLGLVIVDLNQNHCGTVRHVREQSGQMMLYGVCLIEA
jgi:hypothetical protein